jgi:hypothetical protein
MTEDEATVVPGDLAANRHGACVAVTCLAACRAYAYAKKKDGYNTCVCGHTQWAHAITQ